MPQSSMCGIILGVLAFVAIVGISNLLHISPLWLMIGIPAAMVLYVLYDVFWDPIGRKERRELRK